MLAIGAQNGGRGAMKIFAAVALFALLYGIIDMWITLKKILQQLREINHKIKDDKNVEIPDHRTSATEPHSKADHDLSEVFQRLEHDVHGMKKAPWRLK